LLKIFELVLNLKIGVGLQLQFVDVVVSSLPSLVQNGGKDGGKFAKPFTKVFCDSFTQQALVKRIHEKIVEPLITTEGESLFGSDTDAALHFMRGMEGRLTVSVKKPEGNEDVRQLRFETIKRLKLRIINILERKKNAGEPAAKEIPE
jgi:hypothetical protein